jgi:hypothetical protein
MTVHHERFFRLEHLSMYQSDLMATGKVPAPDDWIIRIGPYYTDRDAAIGRARTLAKADKCVWRVTEVIKTVIQVMIIDPVESDISGN